MSERKLIYVDDLEKALLDADCDVCDIQNDYDYSWGFSRDALEEIIKTVPTVDAVPVIHGHWFYTGAEDFSWLQYKCSNCRHENGNEEDYCPKCGAKMDEAAE